MSEKRRMQVNRFDISKVEGYPFTANYEAQLEYFVQPGHPLINPYFESNPLVKYFYWKKLDIIASLPDFDSGATVIDVGCGPGIFLPTLGANFRQVIALDINEDDLRVAKQICDSLHFNNIDIVESDISHADLPDESVDIAFSVDALEHMPEIESALDKMYSLVKPGGQMVISAPTENWINDLSRRVMSYEKPKTHFHDSRQIMQLACRRFELKKKTAPFRLPRGLSVVEMFLFTKPL